MKSSKEIQNNYNKAFEVLDEINQSLSIETRKPSKSETIKAISDYMQASYELIELFAMSNNWHSRIYDTGLSDGSKEKLFSSCYRF